MFNEYISLSTGKVVSKDKPPYIVAEIGLNHNNDLEIGKRTIEAAHKAGASAVKFQSYITEEFIDSKNPEAKFLYDIFKQYELSEKYHIEFQKTAQNLGIDFFSTPLCESSVDLLYSMNVPVIKIASGDIVNAQLLAKSAATGIPIFLSTGAASFEEVVRAVDFLQLYNVKELCLTHCVSMYPTPPSQLNLKTIKLYQDIYPCPVGFSDHSEGYLAASIAVAYNASMIEKHFTLDKSLPGPDHTISSNPEELNQLVENCMVAFSMKGEHQKAPTQSEVAGRFFGRRSLYTSSSGQMIALRPALHVKDNSYLDSWKYVDFKDRKFSTTNKPLRYSDL